MANIKANGNQLISCGESIVNLTDQYIEQINELFDSLSKINQTGWSGNSATTYISKLAVDKKTFITFGKQLKLYGQVVKNTGTNVNRIIEKWDGV